MLSAAGRLDMLPDVQRRRRDRHADNFNMVIRADDVTADDSAAACTIAKPTASSSCGRLAHPPGTSLAPSAPAATRRKLVREVAEPIRRAHRNKLPQTHAAPTLK
jgi:hypothetical protein